MKPAKAAAPLKSFLRLGMRHARRQLQKAGHRNSAGPIHDTRKTIKKLRAALRLVMAMVKPGPLDAVAVPLREAAHRLGPLRDALVLGQTAQALLKRGEKPLPAPPSPPAALLLQEARAQLRSAQVGLDRLLKLDLNPDGLEDGLKRLYRRARRVMEKADKNPNDDNLHAWRRRTKDFYYNLELIAAPKSYTNQIKRLTELLGDDHDLAFLARHHGSPAELKAHRPLFTRLKATRARLQKKAFRLGFKLFEVRPGKIQGHLLK